MRTKHLPRSYRLIALLSCLGKALEKVIARRLSEIAIRTKLMSPIHFGAIARGSAVDAAATLTHDVERAWQDSEVLTTLAFDIKEAFDTITENRLTARLWEQNISLPNIKWVASFLTDRKAAIRLDGHIGSQEKVCIGVPQGSSVAPILFMLFTTPLFKLFSLTAREQGVAIRGYVDDGLLTCRAKKEELSATKIATAFKKVEQWAFDNGMSFDPNKFEAIHFSRKRNFNTVSIQQPPSPDASYNAEPRIVKPTPKHFAMR